MMSSSKKTPKNGVPKPLENDEDFTKKRSEYTKLQSMFLSWIYYSARRTTATWTFDCIEEESVGRSSTPDGMAPTKISLLSDEEAMALAREALKFNDEHLMRAIAEHHDIFKSPEPCLDLVIEFKRVNARMGQDLLLGCQAVQALYGQAMELEEELPEKYKSICSEMKELHEALEGELQNEQYRKKVFPPPWWAGDHYVEEEHRVIGQLHETDEQLCIPGVADEDPLFGVPTRCPMPPVSTDHPNTF